MRSNFKIASHMFYLNMVLSIAYYYRLFQKNISKIVIILIFILLPFLYGYKMEIGFEKVDLYFIWIIGFLAFLNHKYYRLDIVDLLVLLLIVLASFTTLIQFDFDENSIKILITVYFCFGIYCYVRSNISKFQDLLFLITPSLYCQLAIGYWQYYNYGESLYIKGSFFNSGYFGNFLAVCFVLILTKLIVFQSSNKKVKYIFQVFLYFILIFTLVLIFLTLSRASLIGLIASSVFLIFKYVKSRYQIRISLFSKTIITIVVLFFTLSLFFLKPNSAIGRITIYKVSLKIIRNNLILGLGANRFQAKYNSYQSQYFRENITEIPVQQLAGNTFEAFNFILQWWAEYGLFSILLGSLFIYHFYIERILFVFNRKRINLQYGKIAVLICLIISGFFSNPFHCSFLFLLLIIIIASLSPPKASYKPSMYCNLVFKIIPLFISIIFIYYGIFQYRAEYKWKKAANYAKFNSFNDAKGLYLEAYDYLKKDGRFLFNYGAELALVNDVNQSIIILNQANNYYSSCNLSLYLGLNYYNVDNFEEAEKNFLIAHFIVPGLLVPKYQLTKTYLKFNKIIKAKYWLNYTLHYPIKISDETSNEIIKELKNLNL